MEIRLEKQSDPFQPRAAWSVKQHQGCNTDQFLSNRDRSEIRVCAMVGWQHQPDDHVMDEIQCMANGADAYLHDP
jgi:hypothetical protein